MYEKKTVTLGEAADAIVKNGLPKFKGWEQKGKSGEVLSACSIAQGAINLGCTYDSLSRALHEIWVFNGDHAEIHLDTFIIRLNDQTGKSVAEIGEEVRRRVGALYDLPLTVTQR